MLEVHVEEKRYADRGGRHHLALRELRLTARDGEFVCLVGPSGCGKSTLLNIVGGLDPDARASVSLDGRARGRDIGFMFQEPRLMPWLTVLQNVCLVLEAVGDGEARATELLEAMDLGEVLHAFPGTLSGGMQRRVALARAFAIEPKLLLMDEPFVSLDAPTAARLREMLIALWQRQRTTVVFVTHDLREALALADRICFLSPSPGRIVLEQAVTLPRPRRPESPEVGRLYEELLSRDPDLLAGLAAHPQEDLAHD
ncbi:MAG: ABC transporter ATP-binding protein [Rhodocyclaceae bacterium]|nr:ABC transporter ATP-binding protein [Rhodocyclaceae bacterium]